MEIKTRRKPHEPREVKQPRVIKWELIGLEVYGAKIEGYELEIYEIAHDEWSWRVSINNHLSLISFQASGFKPTAQQAKNAAVFQMNKHKKSLIRKTVNHG